MVVQSFRKSKYYCSICVVLQIFLTYLIDISELSDPSIVTNTQNKIFVRSYYSLKSLAMYEKFIYKILKEYSKSHNLSENLRYLDDYTESLNDELMESTDDLEEIIANHPLLCSRMIYRYVVYIKPILKNVTDVNKMNETLKSILNNIETLVGWPTQADVNDTWESILRLHHVHDFDITDIIHGNVFVSQSGSKMKFGLNAKHCLEIGKFAVSDRFFSLAIEWLEAAKILVEYKNDNTVVDAQEIDDALLNAFIAHDVEWGMVSQMDPMFFKEKLIDKPEAHLRIKRRTYIPYILQAQQRDSRFKHINFWSLCSGDDLQTEEEKMKLYCWYDRKSNAAWMINPLKIERLAWSPDVVQIYEVLTNSKISELINEGEPRLFKSQVHRVKGKNKYSKYRTSATAWLNESEFPHILNFPRRIELVTGLEVASQNSAEMLQLATYTFGNRYEVHTDSLEEEKDYHTLQMGDRIATFMIYLSDVERGGYTAFPQAGIAAKPVKGSAVFWYNLKKNGQPDQNSAHGGCPVILGSKWIANKWIRSNDQFLTRTCSLDPNE